MIQGWPNSARCKWAVAIGLGEGRGGVQLGRLGRITLTVVFRILGNARVPTTHAPRVAHLGNWDCKSVGMKNWPTNIDNARTNRLMR
jgi:hypothetical protein